MQHFIVHFHHSNIPTTNFQMQPDTNANEISFKGGRKLVYKGFAYVKKRELKTSTHWQCELRRYTSQCKSCIWTFNDEIIRETPNAHTHAPDATLIETYSLNNKVKDAALSSTSTTQQLLSNVLGDSNIECAVKMPVIPHIKRRVRKMRQQTRQHPEIPTSMEFYIPYEYMKTKRGDDFLLEDSNVPETGKRLLVFATNANLDLMSKHKEWFVDGTFNSCPENFY